MQISIKIYFRAPNYPFFLAKLLQIAQNCPKIGEPSVSWCQIIISIDNSLKLLKRKWQQETVAELVPLLPL